MTSDEVPDTEPDWSALTRAMSDALWSASVVLPRPVERALIAELIDALPAEGVTLGETEGTDAAK